MASNSLSSRSNYLRRPKVCKSSPNPGRCHPPPPPPPPVGTSCDLLPPEQTIWQFEETDLFGHACNLPAESQEAVDTELVATGGIPVIVDLPINCVDPGNFTFSSNVIGDFTLTATYTFLDAKICIASAIVHVVEVPP